MPCLVEQRGVQLGGVVVVLDAQHPAAVFVVSPRPGVLEDAQHPRVHPAVHRREVGHPPPARHGPQLVDQVGERRDVREPDAAVLLGTEGGAAHLAVGARHTVMSRKRLATFHVADAGPIFAAPALAHTSRIWRTWPAMCAKTLSCVRARSTRTAATGHGDPQGRTPDGNDSVPERDVDQCRR
jgi:hypothetical protein